MTDIEYKKTDSVRLSDDRRSVVIIDQTLLPGELRYLTLSRTDELAEAIKSLRVRGAPAIGIFAGYAVCVTAARSGCKDTEELMKTVRAVGDVLISTRPTAVNLSRAAERVISAGEKAVRSGSDPVGAMYEEAVSIHREDIEICRRIAENGLTLIKDGARVLTHCNAGALACSRLGTGLGPLLLGAERGMKLSAFVDETRPLLQGARLTAYELNNAGVAVNLICDDMAAHFMSKGEIDAVFVGCDRVAANGDAANKIGTLSAAVAAKYFGVPFYVFCPGSTIDLSCPDGSAIRIEERDPSEITELHYAKRVAPEGISCRNPAFDVTPAGLITAIVTERGIFRYPYDMRKHFGGE